MTVSIIICTRNRAEHLRKTLESLAQVDVPTDYICELLVVDNGSTDHTREVVESCRLSNLPVRYILEPRKGQAIARNTGISHSRGEIILFTDDDVRVPKNWIEGMCEPILSGKADAVAGGIRIAEELERPWMTKQHRDWLGSTERLQQKEPEDAVGANMAFSRSVLKSVPRFDEALGPGALGYFDDTLFIWQLKDAGFKVGSVVDIFVEHHFDKERLSRKSWLTAAKLHGKSLAYVKRHWMHETNTTTMQNIVMTAIWLTYRRIRDWRDCVGAEGCADWELKLVKGLYFALQSIVERRIPPKYLRRGPRSQDFNKSPRR